MMRPSIILVAPQMGENIGAAARAMKNFGFHDLRIVNPRDGWPNEKAEAMAVGAASIVKEAKIFDTLSGAIADLDYLYATTAQTRDMNKDYITLKNLGKEQTSGMRAGIMFGRERSGLTNEEIALSNKIITIDTTEFSSLNIAQAVNLVCYELFNEVPREDLANPQELCTKAELQHFFDHLFTELDKTKFFKGGDRTIYMKRSIINLFSRIDKLSHNEVQSLRGIISALSNRI